MKLNDFIKKDNIKKPSNYKVVVGNSPKEQQLEKQASQVVVLETKNSELNIKVDKLEQENKFLKEQVKINQHEKDEFKAKVNDLEDIKIKVIEKENRLTDVLEESHELTIKETKNKERIQELETSLNNSNGDNGVLKRENESIKEQLNSVTAKFNGTSAELNAIKDFSDRTQNEYNKIRDRNTVLMQEREDLSRVKSEFEVKSIRLGEELNKANDKIRELEINLNKVTMVNTETEKEFVKSSNLNTKLSKDLDKATGVNNNLESKLHEAHADVKNLSQVRDIYKEQLSREKHEAAEWNIAKQQLKLGNAYTYANKLGFGASPFFKLDEEK